MRKSLRSRMTSMFSKPGSRSRKVNDRGGGGSFSNKLSVNDEYSEVFRTKSYLEMWDRVHRSSQHPTRLSSSSSSVPFYVNLSENLLDPRQETLNEMISEDGINVHHLLTDYFEASLEACHICELLLRSIHQTHTEYRNIKNVMKKLSQRSNYTEEQCRAIFRELTAFARLKNPLSIISPLQFRDIHDIYSTLLNNLSSRQKKIRRRAKRHSVLKKVGGVGLVVSHSALSIALLVFAFHSMIGLVAAPAIIACSVGLCKKKMESGEEWLKSRFDHEIHEEQLDVAAKGIYILINNFNTMSRMVMRLQDEVEHRKAVADLCVRNGISCEVFKGVLREFHVHDSNFMEQLEELEEHVYLCMLTINRSRRRVLQEILATHK
ncbi:UPF0496 protein At1g20180 [Argentina anserina]|uniref:UPF0496 protein At1g20180 n=1 Tax=Argentina anserina TaxID=57926 RepID=UPI0021762881|nr:UPF0496 protein At1g20180 [Potentilla anserina]